MENAINKLRIQNFKSIKDVTMQPRRVNLIIGMPNVGKSNILEAMSLLGELKYEQTEKFMSSFIRYEEPRQIFYDNLVSNIIQVETDKEISIILLDKAEGVFKYFYGNTDLSMYLGGFEFDLDDGVISYERALKIMHNVPRGRIRMKEIPEMNLETLVYTEFNKDGVFRYNDKSKSLKISFGPKSDFSVKSYSFSKPLYTSEYYGEKYLNPLTGKNLIDVIKSSNKLRKEISSLFDKYGLRLLIRLDERRLEVIKDIDGVVYSYPYSSIADTLQRIIFYLAAIESNDDSVLLFEEPEAHTFPVYTSMLGRKIVESRNNQFFIATHSPYLVTEILEQMLPDDEQAGDLAIFLAYYEDYQTKVKQLSDEEVREIRNDSIDVFYNLSRFTPGSNLYA